METNKALAGRVHPRLSDSGGPKTGIFYMSGRNQTILKWFVCTAYALDKQMLT
jgi:hypothetical protein